MENTSVNTLNSRKDCVEAVERLITQAEQHIAIFSQQLEPLLYNHPHICELMSALARKNRHTTIRILAQQTKSIAADGHCLIGLAQRLPTFVSIRIPATPELQLFRESWLIADNHSICQINNPDRYEGSVIETDRLYVKSKLEFFNHAWENSELDPHTRRLSI
jgi:hypothetical protein